jgi:carbohydrate kinase (thermoresistant glucokinase family)
MGVSGSGKSTLGRALAKALDWQFIEGDTLHPPANIARMAAGIPLDDEARLPFLDRVADAIATGRAHGVVAACSALKRAYRERILARAGDVTFVLPLVGRELLTERLAQRTDHFMPASLLTSQLDTLEAPTPEEKAIFVDGAATIDAQVSDVLRQLEARHEDSAAREAQP